MSRDYVEKVIDGKIYDTRKARRHAIGCDEAIYVTKKWAYFLANTKDRTITPLTREEAADKMTEKWGPEEAQYMLSFETAEDA